MNAISPSKSAYLRFLQLVSAVEGLPDFRKIDANEKVLFESICLRWSENQLMTVMDVISQADLGSRVTLHKRLQHLIEKGLVVATNDGEDKRTKYITPSEKGKIYLNWLSNHLLSVQIES